MLRSVKSIKSLKGKRVFLRTDLNAESVKDSFKLKKSLATIAYLKRKGAIVLIASHRGRPKGVERRYSLRTLIPYLSRNLGKVSFIPSHTEEAIARALDSGKPGSLFLLENVRFHPGEDRSDISWGKLLASCVDIYVNDAFASHHSGTTVSVLPKLLPCYIGLQMEAEVAALSAVMKRPKKPLVVLLAGGKAADKFAVIKYLYKRAKIFLVGGILANTFFKAAGMKIAPDLYDREILPAVSKMAGDKKIILPIDWVQEGEGRILDLGSLSVERFGEEINKAGTVIWNGPVGRFEDIRFKRGSVELAKLIARSKAFSIVGGGETTSLILDLGLQKKVGFLSTGGGAMLAFLAGKPHAGLVALGYK